MIKVLDAERRELLRRHGELCAAHRQAIADQAIVVALLKRDCAGRDEGVAVALDSLADPWLREIVVAQKLDALEAEGVR